MQEELFQPTWESLRTYECPECFRDAKFGVWAHWGAASVPMYGNWYARKMYEEGNMNGRLLNPIYRFEEREYELTDCGGGVYKDQRLQATVTLQEIAKGRTRIICEWKNQGKETFCCQPELRIRTDFVYTHYLIPGVSVNGNNWGKGKEPKNLMCDGEPWVFDYRRTAIPACTISENEEYYLALMASNRTEVSLQASCSMIPQEDGSMIHRLLYPCVERPKTYRTRDGYAQAHEDNLLQAGEVLRTEAFVLSGCPVMKNYAAASVEDAALDLLEKPFRPAYSVNEVEELACEFAGRLVIETNGRKMFCIGQLPDEQGTFTNREGYEFGWCGQNGMYARLFLERGFETGDPSLIHIAVSNLDAWTHEAVGKSGLIHTHYHWLMNGESDVEDTCNLGFAVCELSQAWDIMRRHGIDKPDWLKAARDTADFMVSHFSAESGFGKAWNTETGECADPQGTIGAYMIPGLIALWHVTREERWLEAARTACRFYRDRDLAAFECTAGALDTYCIDKESSGPLLAGSVSLYEIDGSSEWLDCAKMAGWYFCSWMFHHDTIPEPESDFARYGYRTLGGTSVSAQHHHIDPWGALVVPQMIRLWEITGDDHWRKRAELMWANAIQNIAPHEGKMIHGRIREAGAQNEGYHHCCWGEKEAPGYINDWLVAWPQAFCWNTARKIAEESLTER